MAYDEDIAKRQDLKIKVESSRSALHQSVQVAIAENKLDTKSIKDRAREFKEFLLEDVKDEKTKK